MDEKGKHLLRIIGSIDNFIYMASTANIETWDDVGVKKIIYIPKRGEVIMAHPRVYFGVTAHDSAKLKESFKKPLLFDIYELTEADVFAQKWKEKFSETLPMEPL